MAKTTQIRALERTRWALKIASAKLDCSIVKLLARVETGDNKALHVWREAVKETERNGG